MSADNNNKNGAIQKLQQILEEAIDIGADSIELEYVDNGLEVCYMFGSKGVGTIFSDPTFEEEIITSIIEKANLEDKSQGVMDWTYLGKQYHILVEEYESFGESAFKLIFRKPK